MTQQRDAARGRWEDYQATGGPRPRSRAAAADRTAAGAAGQAGGPRRVGRLASDQHGWPMPKLLQPWRCAIRWPI